MRLLLISDNKDVRELLSFQLSTRFPVSVKECATTAEGVDILKKEEASNKAHENIVFIVSMVDDKDQSLIHHLKLKASSLPVIFFSEKVPSDQAKFNGILVLGFVEQTALVDGISKLLGEFIQKNNVQDDPRDFCPIRTNLLIRATPLKSDIYIRLSKDKFVKLFQTGMDFDQNDLERYYQAKKVEYMYLKKDATAEFLYKFSKELDALLAKPEITQEEAIREAEMTHEAIQELIKRGGFSAEVQEVAKKNVALTLKAIGQAPKLANLLDKISNQGNYLSQHATLLAHVSCCVAKEMEWGSDNTFTKLVIAAFMHDISLENPELAKIKSMPELEQMKDKFGGQDIIKVYNLHPSKSAEVVRSFKEIPADVDLIVLQHHEKPNGSGFPRGLSHNYIAPLAAVFIVSHDLTQEILERREKFDLKDFVGRAKTDYFQGNFKKVVQALEKMKL